MADLAEAAREFEHTYGLASVEGGRHAGWGTANRIVPLGDAYLELVAVVDEREARRSAFGRWVAASRPTPVRPLGWAVRTNELHAIVERLGLSVTSGSRVTLDGRLLRWRLAGLEQAAAQPALPVFIEWGEDTPFPGRYPLRHPAGAVAIAGLELDGKREQIAGWLGAEGLPITVREGTPAVRKVTLTHDAGEIVLED